MKIRWMIVFFPVVSVIVLSLVVQQHAAKGAAPQRTASVASPSVSSGARATASEVKTLAGSVASDAERLDEHVDRFLQAVRAA